MRFTFTGRRGHNRAAAAVEYALILGVFVLGVIVALEGWDDTVGSELDERGHNIGDPIDPDLPAAPTSTTTPTASSIPQTTTTIIGTSKPMGIAVLTGSAVDDSNKWIATIDVTIHDDNGNPVPNATVQAGWSLPFSAVTACTTDSAGTCAMTQQNIADTQNETIWTVTDVTATGHKYDTNLNVDDTITVYRPGYTPPPTTTTAAPTTTTAPAATV